MSFRLASLAVLVSCSMVLPSRTCAQNSEGNRNDSRSRSSGEITGKRLFEKEWRWTGPAEQPDQETLNRFLARRTTSRFALEDLADGTSSSRVFSGDGLGPLHNATSCSDCHAGGGGADVKHNVTLITVDPRSMLVTMRPQAARNTVMALFPNLLGTGGSLTFNTVVHNKSTRDGYAEFRERLAQHVPGGVDHRWFTPSDRTTQAIAARPVMAGRFRSVDYYLSQRNSPALWGIGSIDQIAMSRVRSLAEKQARITNGRITGRVAGKFGWRGQVGTVAEFVAGACAGELGLTERIAKQANDPGDPTYVNMGLDMTLKQVSQLTSYVLSIARPVEKQVDGLTRADLLEGEEVFHSVGCAICHAPDLHPTSGMFSDLLLHDMGSGLQAPFPAPIGELVGVPTLPSIRLGSNPFATTATAAGYYGDSDQVTPPAPYPMGYPESPRFPRGELSEEELAGDAAMTWDALQREWRTPPLWGVADTAPYLHDGRAETLEQAILWHGGEAQSSRDAFEDLTRSDKTKLIGFLSSLRSPNVTDDP